MASAVTRSHGSLVMSVHDSPPFVLLKMFPHPPAYAIRGLAGSSAKANTAPPSGPCKDDQRPTLACASGTRGEPSATDPVSGTPELPPTSKYAAPHAATAAITSAAYAARLRRARLRASSISASSSATRWARSFWVSGGRGGGTAMLTAHLPR